MTRISKFLLVSVLSSVIGMFSGLSSAHALIFHEIPFEWEHFSRGDLDDYDEDDDNNFGNVALGFDVTIGGATFNAFDMNSNGYVQLLSGAQVPTHPSYGSIADLIAHDPTSSYLLAAYDDLSTFYYGYFGYALESDRAVFYYDTETYYDEGYELLNNFEVILNSDGSVQWNFNYADYEDWDDDLFSGLYFGNTAELHELYSDYIPEEESWIYEAHSHGDPNTIPEPTTMLLFSGGLIGGAFVRRRRRA